MPMNRKLYPKNWKAISLAVRERAGWCCQWCGVKQGAVGARDYCDRWWDEDDIHGMQSDHGEALFGEFPKMTKIILTVHHIGIAKPDGRPGSTHDKMDCRDANLVALCQRCHLLADRPYHIKTRLRTLSRKKGEARAARAAEAGQPFLF